ncbi:MAG: site-specific DNA-methyltransferase [candidate division WOR-3 bacterium]|nr:site-specific DNA-methyltransferase [candidate division WOR-3 bacterium]
MTFKVDKIILGDCSEVLRKFPNCCIDLIMTSPPYANNRKRTYRGVPVNEYVEWFLPIADELKRVLKKRGSFILNIKERVVNGERHIYVLKLITELRKQGWLWTEEYIWYKKNCPPGKWPNRFRDAWERCLHFTKQKNFKMYQENVKVPIGDWAKNRLSRLNGRDTIRHSSKTLSGFGRNVSNWLGKKYVYPTNVLHLSTECSNRNHSAAFPIDLPKWFILLFTKKGDIVLDPFIGSGTTALASVELNRRYIGIEVSKKYQKLALSAIRNYHKK